MAIFCQVHGAEAVPAGIACFHPNLREFLGYKYWQGLLAHFAAISAIDSAKLPLGRTKCTHQKSLAAVTFGAQYSSRRPRSAVRTQIPGWSDGRSRLPLRRQFRIRI